MNTDIITVESVSIVEMQDNLISTLIADKRSEHTKRAYQNDLYHFFQTAAGKEPTSDVVGHFLKLPQQEALKMVYTYKAKLLEEEKTESTVNRKISAIRSLVKLARKFGYTTIDLRDIEGETIKTYRDTSGVTLEQMKEILTYPNRDTFKGKRDYALLRLLFENALRRNEVSNINLNDYEPENNRIAILGKGRGTQKEWVSISNKMVAAIQDYLSMRYPYNQEDPLFITTDNRTNGGRLGGEAIRRLVRDYGKKAGISKPISPHKIRHTAITLALDNTNGDVRAVQQFSRHKNVETLLIYDDNRKNKQKEVTSLLSSL